MLSKTARRALVLLVGALAVLVPVAPASAAGCNITVTTTSAGPPATIHAVATGCGTTGNGYIQAGMGPSGAAEPDYGLELYSNQAVADYDWGGGITCATAYDCTYTGVNGWDASWSVLNGSFTSMTANGQDYDYGNSDDLVLSAASDGPSATDLVGSVPGELASEGVVIIGSALVFGAALIALRRGWGYTRSFTRG